MVEGPVQIDSVTGAGDAQWVRIITTEGNEKRALSGWAWIERENKNKLLLLRRISFSKPHDFVQNNERANTLM